MRPIWALLCLWGVGIAAGQSLSPYTYDIGSPALQDIWVDPSSGNDANQGNVRSQPLRTLTAAWNRIPARQSLSGTGYRIRLLPGTYPASSVPNYWESRWGTFQSPILIEAADAGGAVTLPPLNIFDCRYLYLIGLRVTGGGGDVVHCEKCDHLLIRNMEILGTGDPATYTSPQEALKINQSQHVYIESSDISGAYDNAVDFVAVQYGHVVSSRIHRALDWCMYTKGGSAQIRIEANEIFDCGTGGYTAGQGTGFEFLSSPWLHYEAYDIKFVNNVIHDTAGAAFGVNGGYNIFLAHNTAVRTGTRSHALEFVLGGRSCDGDSQGCAANRAAGGWGPASAESEVPIPNRNVFVLNNLIYNPPGVQSRWQHIVVAPQATPPAGSNVPSPVRADTNLILRGNWIFNGPADHPLGIPEGALAAQMLADNTINRTSPVLTADFRIVGSSPQPAAIPNFPGGDQPPGVPAGNLVNAVLRDRDGRSRTANTVGAYETPAAAGVQMVTSPAMLRFVYPLGGATPAAIPLSVTATPDTTVQAGSSAAWLATTPGSAITPATFQVSVSPGGLPANTYQGSVTLSANGTSIQAPVSLVVFAPGATSQIFADVPASHPWIDYIFLLNRFAITVGCRETPLAYCPGETTTQAQMAAFLIRALMGENFAYPATPYFSDMPASNSLFRYVQKMRELGIHNGCSATQYCPNALVTRGQMATFIARALFGETFQFPSIQRFSDIPASNSLFKYVQKIWDLGVTQGCTATNYCPDDLVTREQMAAFLSRAFFAYQRLTPTPAPTPSSGPVIAGCNIFPGDNVWNTPVDHLPVHTQSAAWVGTIGASRTLHPDFGSGLYNGGPIGIPFVVVPENQERVNVTFEYRSESDPGPYPIPPNPPIEGGANSTGDRHILMLQQGACVLWELYAAYPQANGTWTAGSGAIFDLKVNGPLRPLGWTSADAAGLPILPGLVRYDEVAAGEIKHAIRFTAPQTRREFVWPARHFASSLTGAQYPPMGARFRLKQSYNITGFHPQVQVILRAMKKYGIILADNGSAWYLSGAPDERWNNDTLRQIRQLTGNDFEAVDASSLMIDVNSGQARQP
jgi:hypothetical protein